MTKQIKYLALFLLLSSQCVLIYYVIRVRRLHDFYKISITNEINQLKTINHSLLGSFMNSQKFNNTKLDLPFDEELSEYTLCLYISENHCSSCVNDILDQFSSCEHILNDSNFVIIANFNSNAIKTLKIQHQLRCQIISSFNLNIVVAENKYPCFFVFNKINSEIEMFLFPIVNEPEIIKKYFEIVKIKYFNK